MSRGIVLWPDGETTGRICSLWSELEAGGIATLLTTSHRNHRPHVSLVVGEDLDHGAALDALDALPSAPIPLRIESAGLFPGGTAVLGVVMSRGLLDEHRRVSSLVGGLLRQPWPDDAIDRWTPHLAIAYAPTPDELGRAMPIVESKLPITGLLTTGGVEDGSTGDRWAALRPR